MMVVAAFVFVLPSAAFGSWIMERVDTGSILYPSIAMFGNASQAVYYAAGPGDLIYAVRDGSAWSFSAIDTAGDTGKYPSLALDSSGQPAIAYLNDSSGNLMYAERTGSVWALEVAGSGRLPSLALDAAGNPHVTYRNASGGLSYATRVGGIWSSQQLVASSNVWESSLALDSSGNPHISYNDGDKLYYTEWSGSAWDSRFVDNVGSIRCASSLVLGSDGNPLIAYHGTTSADGGKYAAWDGSSWSIEEFDSGLVRDPWLVLDPAGRPNIGYCVAGASPSVNLAIFDGSQWHTEIVDQTFTNGFCSLAIDSAGLQHFLYNRSDGLYYASEVPEPASVITLATMAVVALLARPGRRRRA